MPKTMIKPGRDLLQRVNQACLDRGYSGYDGQGLEREGKIKPLLDFWQSSPLRHR
jgi:hypothetical protein